MRKLFRKYFRVEFKTRGEKLKQYRYISLWLWERIDVAEVEQLIADSYGIKKSSVTVISIVRM